MKPLYLTSILLSLFCHTAQAQLLDQLGNQIEGVTRELEQVTEDVQEQVRKTAEDEISAQQLLDNTLNPLTQNLENTVKDSLAALLPIIDNKGSTAFVEVRVENNWRAVEREWLMLLDQDGLKVLGAIDAEIIEQTQFAELGLQLIRFRVPAPLDSLAALKKHLPENLHEQLDRNHIYSPQAAADHAAETLNQKPICTQAVKVGMIDTAINTRHPAFANNKIETKNFVEEFDTPRAHGTAVAGILIGQNEKLTPLLTNANLFAASVFYPRNDYAQGATMMNLVRALNWLVEKKVRVINMSLAGPENKILSLAIQKTLQTDTTIVAAAGNEGPAAPAMYPAAYQDVIAVTAVDRNQKIYRWANRGNYIDFAAQGVAVFTARSGGDFGNETGTSMAAPLVTAAVACLDHSIKTPAAINTQLKKFVIDLGEKGRDPVFGEGLLLVNQIK